jgi:hypothetical protein
MIKEISAKVHEAALRSNKIAMFHLQVLMHAHELASTDPIEFCRMIKVPESYATEYRKMISLAKLMREERITLT